MSSTITANLFYAIEPDGGVRACLRLNADPITGEKKRNYEREEKSVIIENVRGKEDSLTLDTAGFQFYKHTSKHTTFANDEEIRNEYYPESTEIIKKLTGANRVEIFDHKIRHRRPGEGESDELSQPAADAHVDQTTAAAIAQVHKHLPAEASKLLERRCQIINLWRPIDNPAVDWPLALCDNRSVDITRDTFPVAIIFADREGETLAVKYNENHKWKYLHGMTPEEFVLIKCFDSIQDGSVAIYTPHTAFDDPTTPEGTPYRKSIELRALVFYD
ncbi:hypothetical protein BYT27DRAFT_7179504 [Phlegmacium glaucopus]|nr:hypothetical protein BYT27DRAFT_7179504 [Phlegmacium glaucopus]